MSVETERSAPSTSAPSTRSDVFDLYLREDDEDRRSLRLSLLVAAVVHIVLLAVTLPAMSGPAIPAEKDRVLITVQPTPRFKKPPPPPEEPPREREAVEIPMPDDTPHDEEPLVLDEPDPVVEPLRTDDLDGLPIPDAPPVVEPDGPVVVGGEIERPERVHSVDPAYTEPARKARIEGVVILEATIDKSGGVKNVRVLRSLPLGLTDNAVNAVKQWRYRPTALNGKPVEVKMTVTVIFSLN